MHHDSRPIWKFTADDRARLQPLLDKLILRTNYAVAKVCELSDTLEGRIAILQGVCEMLASDLREQVLQQVDHGEWFMRGIVERADVSVTVAVDASAAYHNPTANLISLSMLPTVCLS